MPKIKRPPKYAKLRNYAVIYWNGKTHYLGLYASPESRKEYARICAEIEGNPTLCLQGAESLTLDEVAIAYLDHAERLFGKSHYENYRTALKCATDLYGHRPVDEFSPLKLMTVRDEMVRAKGEDWCRNTINRNVDRIRTALSWGVSRELVDGGAPKNKIVAAILAFFLGELGIHWFYLGEKNKAVTYLGVFIGSLVLCLIFIGLIGVVVMVILALIDAIKLLMMSNEDFDAMYNS